MVHIKTQSKRLIALQGREKAESETEIPPQHTALKFDFQRICIKRITKMHHLHYNQ